MLLSMASFFQSDTVLINYKINTSLIPAIVPVILIIGVIVCVVLVFKFASGNSSDTPK